MKNISSLRSPRAGCSDLLYCLYDIGGADVDILRQLNAGGEMSLDELAATLQRDRSTMHRSLSKLISTGMCYRRTSGLKGGGYFHMYGISDAGAMKRKVENDVSEIIDSLRHLAERFNEDFPGILLHEKYG